MVRTSFRAYHRYGFSPKAAPRTAYPQSTGDYQDNRCEGRCYFQRGRGRET